MAELQCTRVTAVGHYSSWIWLSKVVRKGVGIIVLHIDCNQGELYSAGARVRGQKDCDPPKWRSVKTPNHEHRHVHQILGWPYNLWKKNKKLKRSSDTIQKNDRKSMEQTMWKPKEWQRTYDPPQWQYLLFQQ